jgi:hypothetical protein
MARRSCRQCLSQAVLQYVDLNLVVRLLVSFMYLVFVIQATASGCEERVPAGTPLGWEGIRHALRHCVRRRVCHPQGFCGRAG